MGLRPSTVPPSAALSSERPLSSFARHRPLMGLRPSTVPPSAALSSERPLSSFARHRPLMRLAALALGVVALLAATVARAAPAFAGGGYRPPVDAPVADPFRPPGQQWGSGNRGLEYAARPGTD